MGIDPGLTRCGVGVISQKSLRELSLQDVGVILTPVDAPLEQRLLLIEREIEAWIERNKPDVIAVERVFAQHNVRTVMGTGQAAGIALLIAARRGIPVAMHTPSEVKAAVTGSGRAGKVQVAEMVKRILNLETIPKPVDATDALALAITHAWRGEGTSRLASAVKAEKERIAKLRKS
jgi:crossover junction endodeoxyribonuclease RuvC